ncbi:Retrovirus-related Pol polyprotein from transposon 17.6-like Protein [Tribolium castaneum]|uniref:Retrovirus-related Pol polyprotein from transposon 17.6-like Protein n=1 Tax=Tribolium castaneum TaxID=7070 RepID=A0A139W8W5_TRICA|nr:Retrovirus-related Pol polyprotein from transposon 17.6-like Protein [Tribolium castaneum]
MINSQRSEKTNKFNANSRYNQTINITLVQSNLNCREKIRCIRKKEMRLVVDYPKLNEKTVSDKYPLPNITDILCIYFTTLDLASGFHQVQMNRDDIEKTAFSTENSHYKYLRMPFGLKNAPATFQRVMDNILRGIQNEKCLVYLDDIIIFSTSLEEHIVRLKKVFERLRNANFKIQLDKSEFLRKEVAYLRHIITPEGVKPNPEKIKAKTKEQKEEYLIFSEVH